MVDYCLQNTIPLHILVLASNGGVHFPHRPSWGCNPMYWVKWGLKKDTSMYLRMVEIRTKYGKGFIEDIIQFTADTHFKLASMIGRYYAMDRDKRWERVFKAYDLLVNGVSNTKRRCYYFRYKQLSSRHYRWGFLSRGCHPISVMETFPQYKREMPSCSEL